MVELLFLYPNRSICALFSEFIDAADFFNFVKSDSLLLLFLIWKWKTDVSSLIGGGCFQLVLGTGNMRAVGPNTI